MQHLGLLTAHSPAMHTMQVRQKQAHRHDSSRNKATTKRNRARKAARNKQSHHIKSKHQTPQPVGPPEITSTQQRMRPTHTTPRPAANPAALHAPPPPTICRHARISSARRACVQLAQATCNAHTLHVTDKHMQLEHAQLSSCWSAPAIKCLQASPDAKATQACHTCKM